MPTVTMYDERTLPIINRGVNLKAYKFKVTGGDITRSEVAQVTKNYFSEVSGENYDYMVTTLFPQGFRASKWETWNEISPHDAYATYGINDRVYDIGQDNIRWFQVYVTRGR